MTDLEEKIYANALNLINGLGPVRLNVLLKSCGRFEKAWHSTRADLVACGFNPKIVEQIISKKSEIDPQAEYEKLQKNNIDVLLITNDDYPAILKEISAAPPVLYVRGNFRILHNTCIGVVGTRKITPYGIQATQEIVTGLVNNHLTVISGLAFGVDAEALNVAVKNQMGAVAVLATPIDDNSISPKINYQLAQKIMERGCIVSEFPLGAQVHKGNFPMRNRIISGLSVGTVVIEADVDSGALITANYALEQNREVFAVPGSIFSQVSRGTNELIKKGAKAINSVFDIIQELNLDTNVQLTSELDETTSPQEQQIINNLTREPVHIDDLTRALQMPAAEVNAALIMLEMKGRVRNLGGAKFAKIR